MIPALLSLLLASPAAPLSPTPVIWKQGGPPRSRPRLEVRDTGLSLFSDFASGTTIGRHELVLASEFGMDTDLNQDGDKFDTVLHTVDLQSGVVTNLGLASGTTFLFDPALPHAVALVNESSQGNQDLNGDGDHVDSVPFALDLAAGSARNSGLASAGFASTLVSGTWAALGVSEAAQGAGDLNGDGVIGKALFAWDLSGTAAPVNAGSSVGEIQAAYQSTFLFTVLESQAGGDLNGDGDANDTVIHVVHATTGTIVNTGLAVTPPDNPSFDTTVAYAQGPHSVLFVSEPAQREDLNGDGDMLDVVPQVLNLLSGTIVNTQLALVTPRASIGFGGFRAARTIDINKEAVAFHVAEPFQGGVDLNGDGDALDYDILFVHFFATGETRNLGLTVWDFELEDGLLAMEVGTWPYFDAEIHDLAANTTWYLDVQITDAIEPTPQSFSVIRDNWVAIRADDLVLADVNEHTIEHTGIILPGSGFPQALMFHDSGMLTALASEASTTDLNGDGDMQDLVLQILQPELGFRLNTRASSVFLMPGLKQHLPFVALEAHDGVDHNGDGDALDAVVRVANFKLR